MRPIQTVKLSILLLAAAGVQPDSLAAQNTAPGLARPYAFDVVSIRESEPGPAAMQMPQFGPTASGYQSKGLPMSVNILRAFIPVLNPLGYYTWDRIKGAPDWVNSTPYVVDAKVSEADLPDWHKPALQKLMMAAMLEALLIERCKLQTHRESKESTVFNLVVPKSGLKIKESAPDAPTPGFLIAGGGSVTSGPGGRLEFHAATMVAFAQVLSGRVGYPVVDKTGLPGKYDFILEREEQPDATTLTPGMPTGAAYNVDALGLHLDKTKGMVDILVIDHIEKPVEN